MLVGVLAHAGAPCLCLPAEQPAHTRFTPPFAACLPLPALPQTTTLLHPQKLTAIMLPLQL